MRNDPRLPREEALHRDEPSSRAGTMALWIPKQEKVSWRDLVRNPGKDGHLVIDFCASTRSTVKACMLFNQRRKFVGCDLDPEMPSAADPDLVLSFASQLLNPKSDISGS